MASSAPTEAEIREAIGRQILTVMGDQIGDVVMDVHSNARDALWSEDWREDEEATYDRLVSTVYNKADEAVRRILREDLVDAFLTFAAEHPDAPRTRRLAA